MEKYLEGEELTIEEMKKAIRKATIDNTMVPVVCGTAYKNKGVQKLLDAIVDYMPAPTGYSCISRASIPETEEEEESPSSDDEPFAALAFKIMTDPYVGKLCFFRVYSGTVNAGSTVYNSVKDNKERMGRILQMHANHRKDIETCYAGDIAAAVGLKNTTTGDTLVRSESIRLFWNPWNSRNRLSVLPLSRKPKLVRRRWVLRLPSWQKKTRPSRPIPMRKPARPSSPVWASCIWRLSLTVCCVSLRLRQTLVNRRLLIRKPSASRLTLTTNTPVSPVVKASTVTLRSKLNPTNPVRAMSSSTQIVGGAIPKEYIPAVDAGIQGAMQAGVLAGYPVVDVKVTLYDGSYHEVDSSEMAFKIAGSMAFKEAMQKGGSGHPGAHHEGCRHRLLRIIWAMSSAT